MLKRDDQRAKLHGAYSGVYTASKPNAMDLDADRHREQVQFVLSGGLKEGLGTIGAALGASEGYMLSDEDWKICLDILVEEGKGKIPLMAGVFERSCKKAIDKIRYAESVGVDFIQLGCPHNQGPTDEENYRFFKAIDDAVDTIGIILYHTHWNYINGFQLTLPVLEKITDLDSVVAIKWHARDADTLLNVFERFNEKVALVDNAGMIGRTKRNDYNIKMFMGPAGNWYPEDLVKSAQLFVDGKWVEHCKSNKEIAAPKWAVVEACYQEMFGATTLGRWDLTQHVPLWMSLGEGTVNKGIMRLMKRSLGAPFLPQYELSDKAIENAKGILKRMLTDAGAELPKQLGW